jgi:hypothetical protein
MRRTLGALAVAVALTGCGDDLEQTVSPPPEAHPVTLVHATAGGGHPESRATDVSDRSGLTAYVRQFSDELAAKVTRAAGAAAGRPVLAQVVAVGCDVPAGARLEDDVIVPAKVDAPRPECLAPVTTVGVVALSGSPDVR